jgi:hypothetical protein
MLRQLPPPSCEPACRPLRGFCTLLSFLPETVTVTGAFDGDACMLDGLPAWTAHLDRDQQRL